MQEHEVDPYPPMPWRRRLQLLVCALCTVYLIFTQMLQRPGAGAAPVRIPPAPVADKALCAPGQTEGCVGGLAGVIVMPALAQPSQASPAAAASATAPAR